MARGRLKLDGALVVVTGASSGIGAATARELARRGARVVLQARTAKKLEAVAADIEASGGIAHVQSVDLSDPDAVQAAADALLADHGVPDVLVNNAGVGRWLSVEETPMKEAVQMMGTPYFAAFFSTRAFLPGMIQRGSGRVVLVNSPAGYLAIPGAAGYSAARWAVRALAESLGHDLRGTGVGVTHFVAGKVSSDYFANNPATEARIPSIAKLMRTLTPEEAAVLLCDGIERERREVIVPGMMWALAQLNQYLPGLVRQAVRATGWRRPAQ